MTSKPWRAPIKIFIAEMDTEHFQWISTGTTREEALSAMYEKYVEHMHQRTDYPKSLIDHWWAEISDDVNTHETAIGKCVVR